MKRVLAIDLGGTKTTSAVVDETGRVDEKRKRPAGRSLAESAGQICDAFEQCGVRPAAVGVIVPGIYDMQTGSAWCPNLWGQDEVALRDAVEQGVRVPVVIDSDRSGYVVGESWLGVARGLRDVVYVAVGTGIGVGILSAGELIRGAHGIAGAAGWMCVGPRWREEYASCGAWEFEASGPSVAKVFGSIGAEAVAASAREGDQKAKAALERAALYTGRGIANLISVLNPEMVVLGGGLLQGASEWMLPVIREEALRWAQPIAAQRCRLEMTVLGEDAGLFGAARLALEEV